MGNRNDSPRSLLYFFWSRCCRKKILLSFPFPCGQCGPPFFGEARRGEARRSVCGGGGCIVVVAAAAVGLNAWLADWLAGLPSLSLPCVHSPPPLVGAPALRSP